MPPQFTPGAEMFPLSRAELEQVRDDIAPLNPSLAKYRLTICGHTAARLWLEAGVSPTTVQAWLGHDDLTTTQRYLHYLGTSADETGLSR